MNVDFWQITLFAAILFTFLELFASSFFFVGMGLGFLATAIIQWLTGSFNIYRDGFVFATGTAASFFAFRFFFKKPRDTTKIPDTKDINRY